MYASVCAPQVATSGILAIEPVEKALNKAAAAERHKSGRCKELLKGYAALAIMRQAAQALTQYGIRYAHLYMRHSFDALPLLKRSAQQNSLQGSMCVTQTVLHLAHVICCDETRYVPAEESVAPLAAVSM